MYMYLLIGSLGIGLGIIYKKELTKYLLSSLWETTKYYHKANIYLEENGYINNKKEETDEIIENFIIQYNNEINKIKIDNINNYKILKNADLLILQKNQLYKRIENHCDIIKENANLISITNKPFLQVDFIQNEKSIEINDNLQKFYLKGNIILDKVFMKWFMKFFYNITATNYKISIIDENVNMFEMKENEKIEILENGYKII